MAGEQGWLQAQRYPGAIDIFKYQFFLDGPAWLPSELILPLRWQDGSQHLLTTLSLLEGEREREREREKARSSFAFSVVLARSQGLVVVAWVMWSWTNSSLGGGGLWPRLVT
jgi:hypothetical protein